MKKSDEQIRTFLQERLGQDPTWAKKALLAVYKNQTKQERNAQGTIDKNQIGFSGFDGEILSSLADQLSRRGTLSEKQTELLQKKMPKYWRQIAAISDPEKLRIHMSKTQAHGIL